MSEEQLKQKDLSMSDKEKKSSTKKDSVDGPVDSELQNIIEAALYAANEPLGVRKIMALFPCYFKFTRAM